MLADVVENATDVTAFAQAFGKRSTICRDPFGLIADMPDHRGQLHG